MFYPGLLGGLVQPFFPGPWLETLLKSTGFSPYITTQTKKGFSPRGHIFVLM